NWRAELLRQGLSAIADLYFEPGGAISASTAFSITVTYAGGSTQSATFSGISVTNASLPMPTLTAVSLNQDGSDFVGKSGIASPSYTQDVHLVLSGLNTGLTITGVDLQASGFHAEYAAPFGTNNTNGNWRAELLRQGMATTGDLYFEPGGPISGNTAFTVTITYSGGVTQSATFYGISVTNASLPTAQLINYNQDNRDFTGSGNPAAPDGYQDIHFAITGIPTGVSISKVVIFGDGSADLWEYNGLSTSQAIVVDRDVNSSVADLYFQPNRKDRGLRKFYVNIVLSNGTLLRFVVDALVATPQLAKV
ncbi:hypothetical protein, partial [Singulisphaera acidiphila]